jgi:hypothetical protein
MGHRNIKSGLTVVEREYLRMLRPELRLAIKEGDSGRAASFAKEIARLQRKKLRIDGGQAGEPK